MKGLGDSRQYIITSEVQGKHGTLSANAGIVISIVNSLNNNLKEL